MSMSTNDDERWRGDGSAAREALTHVCDIPDEVAGPRAPTLSAEEVARRNAEIAREMQQCTIDGFRGAAAARFPGNKEQYYRAMWRAWRNVRGGNTVRAALLAAAALDGVQLEDEGDE